MIEVTFTQLLTAALEQSKTQHITQIPKVILRDTEITYVKFIQDCLDSQFIPSIDTFRKENTFLPEPSEIPIDKLYEWFTEERRNEWMVDTLVDFTEKNVANGKPSHYGFVAEQKRLTDITVIPSPQVIDYKRLNREQFDVNVYRTSFFHSEFDRMTNGLNGGDFVVLMAGTKGLKTTLLKKFTELAFWRGGENVVFASQEQAVLSMAAQFDAQYTNTAHNELRKGVTPEQMERFHIVQERMAKMPNEFFITPKISTVQQLHEYIASLPVKPKRIFIDGLNLMKGNTGEEGHVSLERTCDQLKDYAVKHDLVIIAVTQANRSGYTSGGEMGAQHLAGAFAIAMYADLLIALTPHDDNGRLWTFCRPILNRHGGLNVKLGLEAIYKNGKYRLDIHTLPDDFELESANMQAAIRQTINTQLTRIGLDVDEMGSKLSEDGANVDVNAMLDVAANIEQQGKDLF